MRRCPIRVTRTHYSSKVCGTLEAVTTFSFFGWSLIWPLHSTGGLPPQSPWRSLHNPDQLWPIRGSVPVWWRARCNHAGRAWAAELVVQLHRCRTDRCRCDAGVGASLASTSVRAAHLICSPRAASSAICSLFVSVGTETAQIYVKIPQPFTVFRVRPSRFGNDLGGISIVDNKVWAAPIILPQAARSGAGLLIGGSA